MYEQYKPLRNLARGFSVEESLCVIWECNQYLVGSSPLVPKYPRPGISGAGLFDWRRNLFLYQLRLLCREILINGGCQSVGLLSLRRWGDFAKLHDKILKYANSCFCKKNDEDIFIEFHRILYQQLPVQKNNLGIARFMRYAHIYEDAEVAPIFERSLGVSAKTFFLLGNAALTQVWKSPKFVTAVDWSPIGISDEVRDRFYQQMTASLDRIRGEFRKVQAFDHTWQYTFNSLEEWPLISLDSAHPDHVYAPFPELILNRITSGVYYSLFKEKGFAHAFGYAFEKHLRLVMDRVLDSERISVISVKPVRESGGQKHGPDFILSDFSATLFVECKTKQLNLAGRVARCEEDLYTEIDKLADAVFQNYRNIYFGLQKKFVEWLPNSLPLINIVITIEEWLTSPLMSSVLRDRVSEKMRGQAFERLLQEIPYVLTSSENFEGACCAIRSENIMAVFSSSFQKPRGEWSLSAFILNNCPSSLVQVDKVFYDEFGCYTDKMCEPLS